MADPLKDALYDFVLATPLPAVGRKIAEVGQQGLDLYTTAKSAFSRPATRMPEKLTRDIVLPPDKRRSGRSLTRSRR